MPSLSRHCAAHHWLCPKARHRRAPPRAFQSGATLVTKDCRRGTRHLQSPPLRFYTTCHCCARPAGTREDAPILRNDAEHAILRLNGGRCFPPELPGINGFDSGVKNDRRGRHFSELAPPKVRTACVFISCSLCRTGSYEPYIQSTSVYFFFLAFSPTML